MKGKLILLGLAGAALGVVTSRPVIAQGGLTCTAGSGGACCGCYNTQGGSCCSFIRLPGSGVLYCAKIGGSQTADCDGWGCYLVGNCDGSGGGGGGGPFPVTLRLDGTERLYIAADQPEPSAAWQWLTSNDYATYQRLECSGVIVGRWYRDVDAERVRSRLREIVVAD